MIKFEKLDVFGWEAAIRGMRNPMNSWDKSDSSYCATSVHIEHCSDCPHVTTCEASEADISSKYIVGPNDLKLMKSLSKAGTDHSKFLRMINVTVDITAPLYWWKEFDTYKVGTVVNSCSTMHKIHEKEFTLEDFSCERILPYPSMEVFKDVVKALNIARDCYVGSVDPTAKKDWWYNMIQLLPTSYNQKRTVQLNYQVLLNMFFARKNHKLDEWREFCEWISKLPYMEVFINDKRI